MCTKREASQRPANPNCFGTNMVHTQKDEWVFRYFESAPFLEWCSREANGKQCHFMRPTLL